MNKVAERLLNGETFINRECTWEDVEKGDIVFCKVRGNHYTHLVKAKNDKRGVLIGNNHGHNNGWTKKVYGKVIEILED